MFDFFGDDDLTKGGANLEPPILACDPGMVAVTLADGSQVCTAGSRTDPVILVPTEPQPPVLVPTEPQPPITTQPPVTTLPAPLPPGTLPPAQQTPTASTQTILGFPLWAVGAAAIGLFFVMNSGKK